MTIIINVTCFVLAHMLTLTPHTCTVISCPFPNFYILIHTYLLALSNFPCVTSSVSIWQILWTDSPLSICEGLVIFGLQSQMCVFISHSCGKHFYLSRYIQYYCIYRNIYIVYIHRTHNKGHISAHKQKHKSTELHIFFVKQVGPVAGGQSRLCDSLYGWSNHPMADPTKTRLEGIYQRVFN